MKYRQRLTAPYTTEQNGASERVKMRTTIEMARTPQIFKIPRKTKRCASLLKEDSDFGGCTEVNRSTSGYVMIYAGGAISGAAKGKQLLPLQQLKLKL
ncbi:hypothetical protein TNCV_2278391 [Trichonephila clavipes]|uniref:Uncharacterized protein n=1 Tax=Trichonephila clavipes TaxID=2585209 RepID=A0A8X6R936_TRICX|nr:hypothetical protein TNCV_2278391 [Trichonephila clavipes]